VIALDARRGRTPRFLSSWLSRSRAEKIAFAAVFGVGVTFRAVHYGANLSLSMDESFIALNVIRRDARGLLETLDWNSGGPVAFLLIENALTSVFGYSELVLRAYPFVASVLALGLFGVLASRLLGSVAALLAFAYFAVLPPVIDYAAITKQYSTDILVGVVILILVVQVRSDGSRLRPLLVLAAVGVVAPALSHPAVFYLIGASASLTLGSWQRRDRERLERVALVTLIWFGTFATAWLVQRAALGRLRESWEGGYLRSFEVARDAIGAIRHVAGVESSDVSAYLDPTHIGAVALVALLALGTATLVLTRLDDAVLLVTPLVVAACSSALRFYPFSIRTILFTAPVLVLLAGAGLNAGLLSRRRHIAVATVATFCVILAFGAVRSAANLSTPLGGDDGVRAAMENLAARQRPGDTVFLHYAAQYPFAYYLTCNCAPAEVIQAWRDGLWPTRPIDGSPEQFSPVLFSTEMFRVGAFNGFHVATVGPELAALEGRRRVWVLRSFLTAESRREYDELLERRSTRLAAFGAGDRIDSARLSLHDFSLHG
jgi:hypothetical protein